MNKRPKDPGRTEPAHADEKAQRRSAESQHGGISSEESARRDETGENPGGTHQGGRSGPGGSGPNGHGASSDEDGGF
ncbi:hypothetical protein [Polyangium mundeleinium]|uniref:Uncharacterized protein n=1 Tax=Polyangium mundeleinium TaxID=2995306 RepID=A0ABT5ESZ1_9BACT|nr:hypothetical protein [Polyangium mundeleinium]MDC0744579.1 hypothetical protein [Polyangium mundeleinium]